MLLILAIPAHETLSFLTGPQNRCQPGSCHAGRMQQQHALSRHGACSGKTGWHALMVTSSSPSATTTRTGGGSTSASSNRSFTALNEFFTCAHA